MGPELLAAIQLLTQLTASASAIGNIIRDHQQNGTPIDLDALVAADDAARAQLQAAIAAAKGS